MQNDFECRAARFPQLATTSPWVGTSTAMLSGATAAWSLICAWALLGPYSSLATSLPDSTAFSKRARKVEDRGNATEAGGGAVLPRKRGRGGSGPKSLHPAHATMAPLAWFANPSPASGYPHPRWNPPAPAPLQPNLPKTPFPATDGRVWTHGRDQIAGRAQAVVPTDPEAYNTKLPSTIRSQTPRYRAEISWQEAIAFSFPLARNSFSLQNKACPGEVSLPWHAF